jgi:GrpB-like predicted nucleotidyltransferase (UPF0157 family)
LEAKPVIDIMAGVGSLDASRDAIEVLKGLNYLYAPFQADVMHWICKPHPSHRTHHLHLIPHSDASYGRRKSRYGIGSAPKTKWPPSTLR